MKEKGPCGVLWSACLPFYSTDSSSNDSEVIRFTTVKMGICTLVERLVPTSEVRGSNPHLFETFSFNFLHRKMRIRGQEYPVEIVCKDR